MRSAVDVETDLIGSMVAWGESAHQWNTRYEGRVRGVTVDRSGVVLIVEPNLILRTPNQGGLCGLPPSEVPPRRLTTVPVGAVELLD